MNRRNMLWSAVSALGAALGASSAKAATEAAPSNKLKVVYHLSDAEKVNFVLGNIQNLLAGGLRVIAQSLQIIFDAGNRIGQALQLGTFGLPRLGQQVCLYIVIAGA